MFTTGDKKFEIRKDEDDAQIGDAIVLRMEWNGLHRQIKQAEI